MIYTTNMIESVNYQLRKVTKNRGHFPNERSASPEVPPHMARMTVVVNSILPCQEAFLVDAPTPGTSPHRWIQA